MIEGPLTQRVCTPEEMGALIGTVQISAWLEVPQSLIDQFAELTGDRQFIHIDPDQAANGPFGTTIAHGFLTLSLLPTLQRRIPNAVQLRGMRVSINYGANRLRFISPVRSGARIRGCWKLLSFEEPAPHCFRRVDEITVEIEGSEKPALVAEWIVQLISGDEIHP